MSLTKVGTGHAVLGGANTYSGPTNINAGILKLDGLGSINNSSSINIAAGAIFDVSTAYISTAAGQTIGGSGTILGNYTHGQGTMAPGGLGAAGTLTINGNFNLTGGPQTTINYNTSPLTSTGNDLISVTSPNTLTLDNSLGSVTVNVDTSLGYTTGSYVMIDAQGGIYGSATWNTTWDRRGAAPTVNVTGTQVLLNVGAAGSAANLKWSGTSGGAWDVVTTPNWYNTGTSASDKYYQADAVIFGDTYVGSTPPATTAVTLNTTVSPTSVTFTNSTLNYTLSGTGGIAGAASLVKSGAGTLTMSLTNNSYTGGTIINGGILSIAADSNLGPITSMTTLNQTGLSQAVLQTLVDLTLGNRPITVGTGGGAIQIASGATLTWAPTATGTGSTAFNGPLTIQGGGTFDLNMGATVSSIQTVGPGASFVIAPSTTLNVGGSDPFTNGSTHMNVTNNGALNITSGSKTVAALSGTGNLTLSAGVNLTATSVAQNTITLGAGDTLTIAAIPGGPSAGGSINPIPAGGSISPVPEPSTWAMLMLAAMGLGIYRRRSR